MIKRIIQPTRRRYWLAGLLLVLIGSCAWLIYSRQSTAESYADRVRETTTTSGTATIQLNGAVSGYQTFVGAGFDNVGDTPYAITDGAQWEIGLGLISDGTPDTLARTTILSSSNSNLPIDLSGGTAQVFQPFPASKIKSTTNKAPLSFGSEDTVAPATGEATLDLSLTNNYTVSLLSATSDITVNMQETPEGSAEGSFVVIQDDTTQRDITLWELNDDNGANVEWVETEPDWIAAPLDTRWVIKWRYDGTKMYMSDLTSKFISSQRLLGRSTGSVGEIEQLQISTLAEEASPTTGDWLLAETSEGNLRRIDPTNLPSNFDELGLTATAVKTSAYTLTSGDYSPVDASLDDIVITLTATPTVGMVEGFFLSVDPDGNAVTIDRNGSNVEGGTDVTDYDFRVLGAHLILQYIDATTGWKVQAISYGGEVQLGVTANGTTQGAGTALTGEWITLTTVTATNYAVTLAAPNAAPAIGTSIIVSNQDSADAATLFPAGAETISGAASYSLAAGDAVLLVASSTSNWVAHPWGSSGGMTEFMDDTSPQAGGDIDLNNFYINATNNRGARSPTNSGESFVIQSYNTGTADFTTRIAATAGNPGFISINGLHGLSFRTELVNEQATGEVPIDLTASNLQTLSLASATEALTVDFNPAPTGPAEGTIVVTQHAATPRDITNWELAGDTGTNVVWLTTEPDWGSAAASTQWLIRWRYDGTKLYLRSSESLADLNDVTAKTGTGTTVVMNTAPSIAGSTLTGSHDAGGADSFEIPNSATPTVNADGEIAGDTTVADWSTGILRWFLGEEQMVVTLPIANSVAPTNGHVIKYNSTNEEFELTTDSNTAGMTMDATEKTANFNAAVGTHYIVDLAAGTPTNVVCTLPATPTIGDKVRVTISTDDITPSGGTAPNKLIWSLNAENLMSSTDDDPFWLFKEGESLELTYVGNDTGWFVSDDGRIPMVCEMASSAGANLTEDAWGDIDLNVIVRDPNEMARTATDDMLIHRPNTYEIACYISAAPGDGNRIGTRPAINDVDQLFTPQFAAAAAPASMAVIYRWEHDLSSGDVINQVGFCDVAAIATATGVTNRPTLVLREKL